MMASEADTASVSSAALTPDELDALAILLRRLLVSLEQRTTVGKANGIPARTPFRICSDMDRAMLRNLSRVATERFWTSRLRWRFRGAWMWPAFALALLGDALILHELPPISTGIDIPVALILSSFGNLILIGAIAPWLARRVIHRDPGPSALPPEVILDRTATFLMVAGAAGLIAAGLAARPAVISETEATEENARLVRAHVDARAPGEIKRNIDTANTRRLADDYFRTCINYDDRTRAYCVFVDTEKNTVTRDPSELPNGRFIR
jgi:hypothetical protein